MSQNTKTLLTIAAEMRTIGNSWNSIAAVVNRKPETCQKWPSRYRDLWEEVYRGAQKKRFDETSAEAHGLLKFLMRSEDDRTRHKAVELWLKCGAAAYGRQGKLVAPAPTADRPDDLASIAVRDMVEARKRIDQCRARKGLPPATDDEFLDAYEAELAPLFNPPPVHDPPPPATLTGGAVLGGLVVLAAVLFSEPRTGRDEVGGPRIGGAGDTVLIGTPPGRTLRSAPGAAPTDGPSCFDCGHVAAGAHDPDGETEMSGRDVMTMRAALVARQAVRTADAGATDRDLLARFADGDQAAFAALVHRHAGMVLGVCRRALSHQQDAEDACQATFLVLARKARAGGWQPSVANWLYATARKVAHNARVAADRRAQREGRAAVPEAVPALDAMTGRELLVVLDEELDRLPAHYREPLVLCYLEGLTRDEAAKRLGVPPATLKSQLERGRHRLEAALTQRGCALGLGLLAVAVSSRAGASPPQFVEAVVAAATGSPPTRVAALAEGAAMGGVWKKALTVLAAAGLVGVGLGAVPTPGGQPKDAPPAATVEPAAGEKTFAGRVVGPDGKPVAGARLFTLYYTPRELPIPDRGTSEATGRFRFAVEKARFDKSVSERPWDEALVVATADGYGLGLPDIDPGKPPADWTVRLVKDDVPITGRIIDLQGRPVAGATVTVHNLYGPAKAADLSAFVADLTEAKELYTALRAHLIGLEGLYMGRDVGRVLAPAVTGKDGRFTLKGVGRERVVTLRIEGPTIASTEVWAMTRAGDKVAVALHRRGPGAEDVTFVGAESEHIVPPCQPVEGVVRDKETGKPVPGAVVEAYVIGNRQVSRETKLRAAADAAGKYRLAGIPKGRAEIRVVPPDGVAYLSVSAAVPDGPGLEPVTVDFDLRRGVWVTGRVTDKATGKPVMATIQYLSVADNPNRADARGLLPVRDRWTNADGTFKFATIPGRGVVAATAPGGRYLNRVGSEKIKDFDRLFFNPAGHTVAEVNPEKGAASVTCDLVLDPGWTLTGTVVGPDGKPLTGTRSNGLQAGYAAWDDRPAATAEFTVPALAAGKHRLLQFTHPEKKLAGSLVVRGTEKGPLTVRLAAAGVLTGRFVTTDGKPLADLELMSAQFAADPLARPDPTAGSFPLGPRTDKDGKFRLDGLAPGLTYTLAVRRGMYVLTPDGDAGKVTVKVGETKDLGELKVKRPDE